MKDIFSDSDSALSMANIGDFLNVILSSEELFFKIGKTIFTSISIKLYIIQHIHFKDFLLYLFVNCVCMCVYVICYIYGGQKKTCSHQFSSTVSVLWITLRLSDMAISAFTHCAISLALNT